MICNFKELRITRISRMLFAIVIRVIRLIRSCLLVVDEFHVTCSDKPQLTLVFIILNFEL